MENNRDNDDNNNENNNRRQNNSNGSEAEEDREIESEESGYILEGSEGEDLMENMEADYRAIPMLD